MECQSFERIPVEIQTTNQMLSDNFEFVGTDWSRLDKFLRKVEPMMTKALKQNSSSRAHQDYQRKLDEGEITVTNSHALKHTAIAEGIQGLAVDWNLTGTMVGVAYGLAQHDDWCSHKGYICTWNIERRTMDAGKADVCIDVESCATALKFHSTQPAFIAIGTYSGEVAVYNLAQTEGNMMVAESKGNLTHKEAITCLTWITLKDAAEPALCKIL